MADDVFPKRKGIFVKTYSKVRPLHNFVQSKASGSETSAVFHPGKPFPFIIPPASITPTVVPNNSPSSDSSSSECQDVEMTCSEVEKPANTEEEDEKSFVTLTSGSKKSRKKHCTKGSYRPLKNISNVIKGMRSSKAENQNRSPFLWTCTKVREHGLLASIQESDQESSSNDNPESEAHPGNTSKASLKEKTHRGPAVSEDQDTRTHTHQDKRGGRKPHHWQKQPLGKDSPMIIQGRRVFSYNQGSMLQNENSAKLYASVAEPGEPSTVTYTRELEESSEESTLVTSDVSTGSHSTTTGDTLIEEDYSDIEIPRDFPEPKAAKVMKQLTPKVVRLFFPDEIPLARTTPRKSHVFTTKALSRKYSSTRHNKKPTGKKNSTLLENLSALNIQEYGPVGEISEIKEITGRDLVLHKIASTPNSKDRNTVVHQRFNADVSSIDGDACAMPTIDAIQSADTPILADDAQPSTAQKPTAGVKHGSTTSKEGQAPGSVSEVSSKPGTSTPLGIKGRKALTVKRISPRMSPRVSFSRYPTAATKSAFKSTSSNSSRNSTNSVSGGAAKHVKFLLSNRDREVLPDPGSDTAISVVHRLPDLSPSSSILKKRDNSNAESVTPVLFMTDDTTRSKSLGEESKKTTRHRMTSTPQRHSRRTKGAHMLELSFDVSAVNLPSSRDDDLITLQPSGQTRAKTTAKVTTPDLAPVTVTGQSSPELMDVEPIPLQASQPVINTVHSAAHSAGEAQVKHQTHLQEPQNSSKALNVPGTFKDAQHLVKVTHAAAALQDTQHPVKATESQTSSQNVQEYQHPVPPTCAEPKIPEDQQKPQNTQTPACDTPNVHRDEKEHTTSDQDMVIETQNLDHGTPYLYSPQTNLPTPNTDNQCIIQDKRQHPVHTTPRAQLKRSSPSSDLPGRPSKKKFTEKGKSTQVCSPPSCDRATQKDPPRQKRLEYVDKAVGPPECVISKITSTPIKPARFWQCVNKTSPLDYDSIRNLPGDIFETIPDAVFS